MFYGLHIGRLNKNGSTFKFRDQRGGKMDKLWFTSEQITRDLPRNRPLITNTFNGLSVENKPI